MQTDDVDDYFNQLASKLSSMLDECGALFEGGSSDNVPHNDTCDDAGVPVNRNYHPHLNGVSSKTGLNKISLVPKKKSV